MQNQKVIEQLGYSSSEAKVYLASLALGSAHISDIAAKVKMPRSSVEAILHRLHEGGLMNFYVTRRYRYWVAEKPEKLVDQLRRREEVLHVAMPSLTRLHRELAHTSGVPEATVYEGVKEIQYIFNDVIETKSHISACIPGEEQVELFLDTARAQDFIEARARRFLRVRVLVTNPSVMKKFVRSDTDNLISMRVLPNDIMLRSAFILYGGKVALILINEKKPMSVLIKDRGMADTFFSMFEYLWNHSNEHKGKRTQ